MSNQIFSSTVCFAETLSPSEHAAQLQKSEILEESEQPKNSFYTIQSVERTMKKVFKYDKEVHLWYFGGMRLFVFSCE